MAINVGSEDFEKTEQEIVKKTQDTFGLFYPIYWSGLKTLKLALGLLIQENIASEIKYVNALLILANRSIQHLESMRLLSERGLYGDAFILSRSLMSNVAMIQYLRYKPEYIEDFLKESREDYQDKKTGFGEKFSENTIHTVLTEAGVQPFKNSFQLLSKTTHASAFGAQLFGSRGSKSEQYHLKYGPGYETEKAAALYAIMSAGHFDLLDNVLMYRCKQDPTPDWEKIFAETDDLKRKVTIFSESLMLAMNAIKSKKSQE